ncbi:MAG: hypothetical protein CM15mP8_3710 [Methanobacteriota archaeon]|nr:MAG: hypothetical protein CM15mP8_3710 [Euryarchaeota archaeon]
MYWGVIISCLHFWCYYNRGFPGRLGTKVKLEVYYQISDARKHCLVGAQILFIVGSQLLVNSRRIGTEVLESPVGIKSLPSVTKRSGLF